MVLVARAPLLSTRYPTSGIERLGMATVCYVLSASLPDILQNNKHKSIRIERLINIHQPSIFWKCLFAVPLWVASQQ